MYENTEQPWLVGQCKESLNDLLLGEFKVLETALNNFELLKLLWISSGDQICPWVILGFRNSYQCLR